MGVVVLLENNPPVVVGAGFVAAGCAVVAAGGVTVEEFEKSPPVAGLLGLDYLERSMLAADLLSLKDLLNYYQIGLQ